MSYLFVKPLMKAGCFVEKLQGYDVHSVPLYLAAKQKPKPSPTLQRKSHLCIPFLGIKQPQPQFPHSCVCERLIQYIPTYCTAPE